MLPPLGGALHANGGGLAITLLNWSRAVAANCCARPCFSVVVPAGETLMLVTVAFTVTTSCALVVIVPSEMPTCSVYVPALKNVAVEFLAALDPLALKLGDGAPPGRPMADHVYVSALSPLSSAPTTLRLLVFALTGFGFAAGGVATVGARSDR